MKELPKSRPCPSAEEKFAEGIAGPGSKASTFDKVQNLRSMFEYQTSHTQRLHEAQQECWHLLLQSLLLRKQEREFHILLLHDHLRSLESKRSCFQERS